MAMFSSVDKNIAQPVLKKDELLRDIATFLSVNSKTNIGAIRNSVYQKLKNENIIGEIRESSAFMTTTYNRRISDKDALLINECIYDLLYARVLTPGVDESNLELPWVHVSDIEKLNNFI